MITLKPQDFGSGRKFCGIHYSSWHWINSSRCITRCNNFFFGISLISSATYVLNDLRDINIDKSHPIKKSRPIASGRLKKNQALFFCLILICLDYFCNESCN